MGGCATKPKVAKDGEEPEPEPQQVKDEDIAVTKHESLEQDENPGANLKNVDEFIHDDDQSNTNTRHSLSLLFNKENEDAKVSTEDEKVSTEDEKTKAEETVKHETLEDKKPLEGAKSDEPTVKHESPKKEEILYRESKINEPAEKQESAAVVEEKSSSQNQSTVPAKEILKTGIPEAAKITSEETKINEPEKETVVILNQNTNAAKNEDAKVSKENEKTKAEDTVKQETFEDKKPLEGATLISKPIVKHESPKTDEKLSQETKSNVPAAKQEPLKDGKISEPIVKQESPMTEEKPSQETKIIEPTPKQESAVVAGKDKPTLQNQIADSAADVTVKIGTPEEAKKTLAEAKINQPVVEVKQNQNAIAAVVNVIKTEIPEAEVTVTPKADKVSQKTRSYELNEPMKQEKLSETIPIEDVAISPPKKKVVEVVSPNEDSGEQSSGSNI